MTVWDEHPQTLADRFDPADAAAYVRAREAGRAARLARLSPAANPFRPDERDRAEMALHYAWDAGYRDAGDGGPE